VHRLHEILLGYRLLAAQGEASHEPPSKTVSSAGRILNIRARERRDVEMFLPQHEHRSSLCQDDNDESGAEFCHVPRGFDGII